MIILLVSTEKLLYSL